jgi:hypothetical protein
MMTEPQNHSEPKLREVLRIPSDALVICRHGGHDTFNLPAGVQAVKELVKIFDESKLHFVFLGTDAFMPASKQVHYLGKTASPDKKEQYFETCDAMLHARKGGEIFSMSVGEASIRNIPVITTVENPEMDTHVKILGDKAFLYKTKEDIIRIITGFVNNGIPKKDYNCYREYLPENVMAKFKSIFLDPIFGDSNATSSMQFK